MNTFGNKHGLAVFAALAVAFLATAGWGVFVHWRGASTIVTNRWSARPADLDLARQRVWDGTDPQFLRGLR